MRFFHRFKSINYNFLGLVNGVLLRADKKTKFTRTLEYLKKYEYVLDRNETLETSDKYPDKIWQCWLQGEDKMPEIVKKCVETIKKYHGDRLVFLDGKSISDYIDIPDYILEKYKKGIIPHANFSDICRLMLIAKYGGTWADPTTYFTGKIPDEILNAEFFTYQSARANLLPRVRNLNDFEFYCNNFNTDVSIESPYFMGAKPGNKIINGVLHLLLEYWKHENGLYEYLIMDKFFVITVLHNKENKEQFQNMPKYYLENVLLLAHALFEPFNQELFDFIKNTTTVHKLTRKNLHRNPYKNSFLKYILKTKID